MMWKYTSSKLLTTHPSCMRLLSGTSPQRKFSAQQIAKAATAASTGRRHSIPWIAVYSVTGWQPLATYCPVCCKSREFPSWQVSYNEMTIFATEHLPMIQQWYSCSSWFTTQFIMYVCMCKNKNIHIHIHIYIYTYAHVYIYTFVHIYIKQNLQLYIYTYKHMYTCTYIHTLHYITLYYIALHFITLHYVTLHYITLHVYMYTCEHIYVYIFANLHVYTPILTYTQVYISMYILLKIYISIFTCILTYIHHIFVYTYRSIFIYSH